MKTIIEKAIKLIQANQKIISIFLLVAGLAVYLRKLTIFASTTPATVWDEGMYMLKGYLFTSGQYVPFEDFGVWTNQLPLSYFFAGLPQVLFGPGLRTGRAFAVAIGFLSLLGLSLGVRRLKGNWWSSGIVWVVTLNLGWVLAYSQLFSQSMVSFLLAWMIFFLSGKNESVWEIGLAALFASAAGMVRINVLPVVALLVIYVFWRYGKKAGIVALITGLVPIVVIHMIYWPNILKIWAYWIPESLFPMISEFRSPWREIFLPDDFSWLAVGTWWRDRNHLAWEGIGTFIDGMRANFVSWFGVLVALVLWPRSGSWKSDNDRKLAIFYTTTYLILFVLHTWVSMGGKTCQFSCFPGYFLFFNWFGLLAVVASADVWQTSMGKVKRILLIILILLVVFGFFIRLGDNFRGLRTFLLVDFLQVSKDALKNEPGAELGGFWQFLDNSLGFDSLRWLRFVWLSDLMTKALWSLTSLVIVLGLPVIIQRIGNKFGQRRLDFGYFALTVVLILGVVGGSGRLLSQPMQVPVCDQNIIDRQELVGEKLREVIPPGTQVFWDVKSSIPLLYLMDVEFFLPQLDAWFTMIPGSLATEGQNEEKARFGWWDYEIGLEWIEQSDLVVVQNKAFDGLFDWQAKVEQGEFNIIQVTEPYDTCTGSKTQLIVLDPQP